MSLDRRILARSFLIRDRLVKHQLESFNAFLDHGIHRVVLEFGELDLGIQGTDPMMGSYTIKLKLEGIQLDRPKAGGTFESEDLLYPLDAKVRNLSYWAPIRLLGKLIKLYGNDRQDLGTTEHVFAGYLPIMVKSKLCNLYGLSEGELIELGEDPMDPGGYFIINGSERVIVAMEDLVQNRILCEYEERYGENVELAKVFSQRMGYRAAVTVSRTKDQILIVNFPSLSKNVKFVTVMKALGVDYSRIPEFFPPDPEIQELIQLNLEQAEAENQEEALDLIGKAIASAQAREYRIRRAIYSLERHLLPHLGVDRNSFGAKAGYLARMAQACLELVLGRRQPEDKDHYANKRLRLAGELMEDIFRAALAKLIKDVQYQLERMHQRGKEPMLSAAVRSDILTDRLLHPMATGTWVGGRTGVSQLLDRTCYISMLSHLRRAISPLSRSQPHFEARDLHPTHWGRICAIETPEGPNCGLVKNLALGVEISTDIDPEMVRRWAYKLGVKPPKIAG